MSNEAAGFGRVRTAMFQRLTGNHRPKREQRKLRSDRCVPLLEELENRLMLATVVLTPTKDNTLYQPTSSTGQLSNARGELFSGRNGENGGALIRRAVMAFDFSSIPSTATVTNVSLEMYVSRAASAAEEPTTLHRMAADWGEGTSLATERGGGQGGSVTTGDVTWTHRFWGGATWSSPGGDFGSAVATAPVGPTGDRPVWTSAGMLHDVRSWIDSPSTNYGWMVRVREGNEAQCCTTKRFHSRENSNQPRLTVTFTDPASLAVNIVADSISEGAGAGATTATVTRTGNTSSALAVSLASSDTSEATVPTTVIIPSGQTTSPAFNIDAVDDSLVDGAQTVTITASATDFANATDSVIVTDDDVATLTLAIVADSIGEAAGAAATTATVSRNTATTSALVVNLASGDISEATVAGSVTIAAGQTTSPAFNINAVDDDLVDGTQTVTITGSSSGFVDGTDTVDVTDDDVSPTATGHEINGEGNSNRSRVLNLLIKFDQAVTVADPTALRLINQLTGQPIDLSAAKLVNNGSMEVTWDLSDVILPPGNYTAELLTTGASSTAGENPLAWSHAFSFHIQPGDSSGDRNVNFVDFGEMAANFGLSVGPLGPGDFDGNGLVNFIDFALLSANFGVALAPLTLDFGDSPAGASYPTTLAENGAHHVVGDLFLGSSVDGEADGQPSADSTGDDSAGDDEDGVTCATLQAGSNATVTVTASAAGVLNSWIDYNADGDWDDAGEHVFVDQVLSAGVNNLSIGIPASATVGTTFARLRLTSSGGYSYTGLAPDGEVEDHTVTIAAASSSSFACSSSSSSSSSSSAKRSSSFASLASRWASTVSSASVASESGSRTRAMPAGTTATWRVVDAPAPAALTDKAVLDMVSGRGLRQAERQTSLDECLVDEVIAKEF